MFLFFIDHFFLQNIEYDLPVKCCGDSEYICYSSIILSDLILSCVIYYYIPSYVSVSFKSCILLYHVLVHFSLFSIMAGMIK